MKMYEVVEFVNFYEKIKEKEMPLKTAYKFSRLMQLFEKEVEFYQNEFAKILQCYGKKDEKGAFVISEDGESVEIIAGLENECNAKIFELRNLEVDTKDYKFNLNELDNFNLTLNELSSILSLIEE